MRAAFSMIGAIVILILVATLLSFMVSTSSFSIKNTTDLYIKTQMELLAQSAIEVALLKHSSNNTIEFLRLTYNDSYIIDVNITQISNISTIESSGTSIFDVYVDYNGTDSDLRFHRRTIQKP